MNEREWTVPARDGGGTKEKDSREQRVLLLLPCGREAELACRELDKAGIVSVECRNLRGLVQHLGEGAGVAILAEEVLRRGTAELFKFFDEQETWSDLPVIVLIRQDGPKPDSLVPLRAFERHPKIKTTFLQRPVSALSLLSSVRSGLRSRMRQYQVRDLLAQLNDDVRLRDQFLAMLGHELRNPVSSIGYVSDLFDMAGSELSAERVSWGAQVIGRQVRHLSRLLDQLLDVARVQSGKVELEHETLDLRKIAEQCVEAARAGGRLREWRVVLPAQRAAVHGDRVRLAQVVDSLLDNAIKYTEEGGRIVLEVRLEGSTAVLTVTDNGRGMQASTLSHVFKPFYQEGGSRAGRPAGLGLGLAMAENLVRLHGGTITAGSPGPGRGSRFELRLRLHEEGTENMRSAEAEHAGPARLRLLVVEDNAEVAQLFAMLLKSLGHEAHIEYNGESGVEAALRLNPHLAFIDIGLPDIDGSEAARRIVAAMGDRRPRLVALTGFPENPAQEDSQFDDYLLKPVSRRQVEDLFKKL